MGAAVSAANRDKRRVAENSIISLDQAHQHMRIYQHRGNGEILVLIDEDIGTIQGIRHTDWDLMKVNNKQQEYFRKVKVDVEISAKNVQPVQTLKDSLPPRSPNIAEAKHEAVPRDYANSASTVLTPSGISTPSSSKNIADNFGHNWPPPRGADLEADAKIVGSSSTGLLGIAHQPGSEHSSTNSSTGAGAKNSVSTPDLFNADERMKMTLTSLKAAAVSESSSRFVDAKRSPRAPNLSSSVNSFSSFDASESKLSPTVSKSLFSDEIPRRKPGDRRRFEPRPYYPAAQRALNDRSLDDINSQSQSLSQSVSQSFSQSMGAKDDTSTRSYHSIGSETLFSSGHVTSSDPLALQHCSLTQLYSYSHCQLPSLMTSLATRQMQCSDCGRVFVGVSAAEALRDHSGQCAERQIMRQSFDRTNAALLGDLQELSLLESYDFARAALPRLVRSLDEASRRLRSYLIQAANLQHMNANFVTARRLHTSLTRLLQDVERLISDVHSSLLLAPPSGGAMGINGSLPNSSSATALTGPSMMHLGLTSAGGSHTTGSAGAAGGNGEAVAAMAVFRHLNALQVLAQRALQRLQDKVFVMEQCGRAIIGLQHFDFLRTVGKGGFGAVYLACRKADRAQVISSAQQEGKDDGSAELLSRTNDPGLLAAAGVPLYAVKAMQGAAIRKHNAIAQVMREKMVMAQANKYSDFYVRMLCSFTFQSQLFLAMEYCPGGDCLTLLSTMRRFPEIVAQHFIAQVCVAVQHLHLHGVVHRDIKPDNVLITARGHVKLGDFGLSVPYPAAAQSAAQALVPSQSPSRPPLHQQYTSGSMSTSTSLAPPQTPRSTIQQAQRQQQLALAGLSQSGQTSSSRSASVSSSMPLVSSATAQFPSWLSGSDGAPMELGAAATDEASLLQLLLQDGTTTGAADGPSLPQPLPPIASHGTAAGLLHDPAAAQLQRLCQVQQATLDMLQAMPATPSEPQSSASHLPSTDSSSSLFFGHVAAPGLQQLHSRVGNYFYSCPEIVVGRQYDHSVDYWAVAVMTFHFVAGCTPFEGEDKKSTLDNIVMHKVQWSAVPRSVSAECKAFIEAILCAPQPQQRLGHRSAADVLGHPFFLDVDFATLYDGFGPLFPQLPAIQNHQTPASQFSQMSQLSMSQSAGVSQSISTVVSLQTALTGAPGPGAPLTTVATSTPGDDTAADHNASLQSLPLFTMLGEDETADLPDFNNPAAGPGGVVVPTHHHATATAAGDGLKGAAANLDTDRDFEIYTLYP